MSAERRPTPSPAPVPGSPKNDPILVADSVTRSFGGLMAVNVDHLEIERHKITALIGPNGAGKTTFFNLLTGFDKPDSGYSRFDGHDMADSSAYKVAQLGMVRTFQLTKALARLTVIENMRLGASEPARRDVSGRGRSSSCGSTRRRRSPLGPMRCSNASRWITCVTSSPAACRVASASCSRWPGR